MSLSVYLTGLAGLAVFTGLVAHWANADLRRPAVITRGAELATAIGMTVLFANDILNGPFSVATASLTLSWIGLTTEFFMWLDRKLRNRRGEVSTINVD